MHGEIYLPGPIENVVSIILVKMTQLNLYYSINSWLTLSEIDLNLYLIAVPPPSSVRVKLVVMQESVEGPNFST